MGTHPIFESDFDCLTDCSTIETVPKMGLDVDNDPRKIYARAIELFNMKNYQDSSYLFENCIQNLEKGSIELLPSCLNKLAECYEAQNNVQKACIFKKFEKMYYEQVLVKKSLDMIDEEKENYQAILNRVAKLEKIARLCDENDCANLALDYMTRASSIKENYFLDQSEETTQFEKIMNEMISDNIEKDYKNNIDATTGLRKRGSILKPPGGSFGATKGIEKKKVHWPENLPRYTIEKRWRNLKKVLLFVVWIIFVEFLSRNFIPTHLFHTQIKSIAILVSIIVLLIVC